MKRSQNKPDTGNAPLDKENPTFKADYYQLIQLVLPTFLRRPCLSVLLNSLAYGIKDLYDTSFCKNREDNIDRLECTGQVCKLRGMLNNRFDNSLRRIRIGEPGEGRNFSYALDNNAYNNGHLYAADTTVISSDNEMLLDNSRFTVELPSEFNIPDTENKLKNLLNTYKLVSKKYIIKYI